MFARAMLIVPAGRCPRYCTGRGRQLSQSCIGSKEEGLVFIKVVAMPHESHVEFDTAQARTFANQILAAVDEVESGWVGGNTVSASDA
jgi:hypothetical protein